MEAQTDDNASRLASTLCPSFGVLLLQELSKSCVTPCKFAPDDGRRNGVEFPEASAARQLILLVLARAYSGGSLPDPASVAHIWIAILFRFSIVDYSSSKQGRPEFVLGMFYWKMRSYLAEISAVSYTAQGALWRAVNQYHQRPVHGCGSCYSSCSKGEQVTITAG